MPLAKNNGTGIRANAFCKSHAELEEASELDRGVPRELGGRIQEIKETFGHPRVFIGSCDEDEERILELIRQLKTG